MSTSWDSSTKITSNSTCYLLTARFFSMKSHLWIFSLTSTGGYLWFQFITTSKIFSKLICTSMSSLLPFPPLLSPPHSSHLLSHSFPLSTLPLFFLVLLVIEPRALPMTSKHSITDLYLYPSCYSLCITGNTWTCDPTASASEYLGS